MNFKSKKKNLVGGKKYLCGDKSFKSKKNDNKYLGKDNHLNLLGEGGYASACNLKDNKVVRVVNQNKYCNKTCLKNEFYNVKLLEKINKKSNYAPIVYSNHIDCNLKACILPTTTYSIQEKYTSDLSTYLNKNPIGLIDFDIAKQIINIVQTIHNNGIYHRDIKTENFLVKILKNIIKVAITDFGLSIYKQDGKLKKCHYVLCLGYNHHL